MIHFTIFLKKLSKLMLRISCWAAVLSGFYCIKHKGKEEIIRTKLYTRISYFFYVNYRAQWCANFSACTRTTSAEKTRQCSVGMCVWSHHSAHQVCDWMSTLLCALWHQGVHWLLWLLLFSFSCRISPIFLTSKVLPGWNIMTIWFNNLWLNDAEREK